MTIYSPSVRFSGIARTHVTWIAPNNERTVYTLVGNVSTEIGGMGGHRCFPWEKEFLVYQFCKIGLYRLK
jgi:hypothetical protein